MKVIEYTFAEYTDSRELLESRPPRVIDVYKRQR